MERLTISFEDLDEIMNVVLSEAGSLERKATRARELKKFDLEKSLRDRSKLLNRIASKFEDIGEMLADNRIKEAEIRVVSDLFNNSEEHIYI